MTFDASSNILKMQPTSKGDHHLKLVLEDEDGESAEELLEIRFDYDLVIEEEIKIIKSEIGEIQEEVKEEEVERDEEKDEDEKTQDANNGKSLAINENFKKLLEKFLSKKK